MIILGIETSCDETSLALYSIKYGLISYITHSQFLKHSKYGGIVPEIASREHTKKILSLFKKLLFQSNIHQSQIDIIACTGGPGLSGSLLIGALFGNSLAFLLKKPVTYINHLEGHILVPFLTSKLIIFPFLSLLISGGHTQLILVKNIGEYKILGETLDDAVGEILDKLARSMNISYPGGAIISKFAKLGISNVYNFPRPMIYSKNFNFSFSGLKTSVLRTIKNIKNIKIQDKYNISKSILEAIIDVLKYKVIKAIKKTNVKIFSITGGVSANKQIKKSFKKEIKKKTFYKLYYPKKEFCTDNGVMIAFACAIRIKNNICYTSNKYLINIDPKWSINNL
ncbi:tRNA (adenosine(37)-N6)-threonylcarbamoyltransferase complex transferase subunit TsaD [Candidatus Zinderia endosymbiont of Aphrophora alni]|uniref:tRNA (adenosine(37)-N6)-threonylcarbamoyltransferase complex transferase subunit TsaD n=1 Tax=Candidatus Zinderia endosymbiont of Aphrophora alni TaxID=3077951 RepID=UPI0030CB9F72